MGTTARRDEVVITERSSPAGGTRMGTTARRDEVVIKAVSWGLTAAGLARIKRHGGLSCISFVYTAPNYIRLAYSYEQ